MSSGVSSRTPSGRHQVPALRPLHAAQKVVGGPPQPPDGRAPQGLAAWSQKLGERLRPAASTRHEPAQPQGMAGQSPQQGPLESRAQPHGGLGRQHPASSHASLQGLGLSGLGTHSPPLPSTPLAIWSACAPACSVLCALAPP
ncbi:unnamed protein product [Rangifer tarandus platyrhynchus]|uniref:Uncharacterized protein n=1 Tax=Rangifer tarandus platyrhynchus TaxID=3082113 RepID=A0AC59YAY8_RANTA